MEGISNYLGGVIFVFIFVYIFIIAKLWEKTKLYHHIILYLLCYFGLTVTYNNFFFWKESDAMIALGVFMVLFFVIHLGLFLQIKYESKDKE